MRQSRDGRQPELEDRLRGLIMVNQAPQSTISRQTSQGPSSSPGTTDDNPSYAGSVPSAEHVVTVVANSGAQLDSRPARHGRKRPNQAQRRQMSSELSVALSSQWTLSDPNQTAPEPRYPESAVHTTGMNEGAHSSSASRWTMPPVIQPGMNSRPMEPNSYSVPQLSRPPDLRYQRSSWSKPVSQGSRYTATHPHNNRSQYYNHEDATAQAALLDRLCYQVVASIEIERDEIAQKEAFRQRVERICQETISDFEQNTLGTPDFAARSVELKCFGSLSSGFATKASDMDLGLFSPLSGMQPDAAGSLIPRLLEKAFLDAGLGARLLSRTRVPIIKLCEKPPEDLRDALLSERLKWELGTEANASAGQEEQEPYSKFNNNSDDMRTCAVDTESKKAEQPAGDHGVEILHPPLRQNPQSSLQAYYELAKRVLRRAGGRDVTLSNYRELKDPNCETLNAVCDAFVRGLKDTELRDRLHSCPSLSFENFRTTADYRSLAGVYIQVQGEQLILTWEKWSSTTVVRDSEEHVMDVMTAWRDVQQRKDFGVDPVLYNRDLQVALERLKRLPSIRLCLLEQEAHESAAQYHQRAQGIVNSLPSIETNKSGLAREEVALRYISGIYYDKVRMDMVATRKESQHQVDLHELGQKHKCLHLAYELEVAMDSNTFRNSDLENIKAYIEILRSPPEKTTNNSHTPRGIIPITRRLLPLISTVRLLQRANNLTVNQSRERHRDILEFPSGGVGVQCDINFSAHLALQNTSLLRCYSLTDPRVRPMVLFIKRWAKVRGINSGYRGTLGSYGYVLMVLHYLVNVARPFVCPNLQQLAPPSLSPSSSVASSACQGYNVHFWRNENEIMQLASSHQLTHNTQSIGHLLRGFFEYFAQNGPLSQGVGKGFDWGRDVVSLRTHGGLLTKQEKGWTGARTVLECQPPATESSKSCCREESLLTKSTCLDSEGPKQADTSTAVGKNEQVREVRHRYLFAIEDPFELDHNVARTVTHNGIVSIRDEFRRAWRLIRTAGTRGWSEDLLADINETSNDSRSFMKQLEDIHGPEDGWGQAQSILAL